MGNMKIYSYSLNVFWYSGHVWPGDNKGLSDTVPFVFFLFCYHSVKQSLSDFLPLSDTHKCHGPSSVQDLLLTSREMGVMIQSHSAALSKICQLMARPTCWRYQKLLSWYGITVACWTYWHMPDSASFGTEIPWRILSVKPTILLTQATAPTGTMSPTKQIQLHNHKSNRETASLSFQASFVRYLVTVRKMSFHFGMFSTSNKCWELGAIWQCLYWYFSRDWIIAELQPGKCEQHAKGYDAGRCRAHPVWPVQARPAATSAENQYYCLWHIFSTRLLLYAARDSIITWHELSIYISDCSESYRLRILAFCSWRSGYLSGTRPRLVAVASPWHSRATDVLFQTELICEDNPTVHGEIINEVW